MNVVTGGDPVRSRSRLVLTVIAAATTLAGPLSAQSYSQTFFAGQPPTGPQVSAWQAFRASLQSGYTSVTLSGVYGAPVTCTTPALVDQMASALRTGSGLYGVGCNGHVWWVAAMNTCNSGVPFETDGSGPCNCSNYSAIRPEIGNTNWGGLATGTCAAPTQTLTLTFCPPPRPSAANSGPICAGTTLGLSTPTVTGATYSWTGPNGFTSTSRTPSISSATSAATGTYSVTITVGGCTSAAGTTTVTVSEVPTAAPTNDGPVCTGGTLTLSTPVVAGATYAWTGPNGFASALPSPSIAGVTSAAAGTYSVTVATAACTPASGTTNVLVKATPSAGAGNDGPACAGSTAHLTAAAVPGATYAWTGPNGFTSTEQNPTLSSVSAADGGAYQLSVTVDGCTSAPSSTILVVNPDDAPPAVSAPADLVVDQRTCCGTLGGSTGTADAGLAAFLAGGTSTDDCDPLPARLTPQVSGADATDDTCFEAGPTEVTFRFRDSSGKVGSSTSHVTIRMAGDLNLDATLDPSDLVVLRAYFNGVVAPETDPFNAPLASADLNVDTVVDPSDMVILRSYVIFAISCLVP